ncbi:MAG: anthranilate phosphoribosyltransferase [Candidatus Latescibacteria bacterium]|nr:anthranilate phosphoribosyltransferase [Candidatus Latescibacterota bacterium]
MLNLYLDQIRRGRDLMPAQARQCLETILTGSIAEETVVQLLHGLADKGESAGEITGFAQALLARATALDLPGPAIDLCGTGGVPFDRFNVSTAAAFIVAAGGVTVLKHGNRGSRIANGSFDLLEALQCRFDFSPQQLTQVRSQTNLCLLFAPLYHPAMKQVAAARKQANRRTVFNLAAPLCNPAQPPFQLVGTTDLPTARRLGQVLKNLGRRRALVVTGEPGIDDLSISGTSHIVEWRDGAFSEFSLHPTQLGIEPVPYDQIPGGDYRRNAGLFLALLEKGQPHPLRDLVCLNAGAAFYCAGETSTIEAGYTRALELLEGGHVWRRFVEYRSLE